MAEGIRAGAPISCRPFLCLAERLAQALPGNDGFEDTVHLRDHGVRPFIELEPTDHPLALEQRNGISVDRAAEIYAIMMHGADQ